MRNQSFLLVAFNFEEIPELDSVVFWARSQYLFGDWAGERVDFFIVESGSKEEVQRRNVGIDSGGVDIVEIEWSDLVSRYNSEEGVICGVVNPDNLLFVQMFKARLCCISKHKIVRKWLIHFIYGKAFVGPSHAKALLYGNHTVKLFFFHQEQSMHQGVILNDQHFILAGQYNQKRIFGSGLPWKIVEPTFLFDLQRHQLLMFFENVLLRMKVPESQIIFPHEKNRFRPERMERDPFDGNTFDASRVYHFLFAVVKDDHIGALGAYQQTSNTFFGPINRQLLDCSLHSSAHRPHSVLVGLKIYHWG